MNTHIEKIEYFLEEGEVPDDEWGKESHGSIQSHYKSS